MSQVPAITIPIAAGSADVPIPALDPDLACDGEVYAYGGAGGPGSVLEVPTLGVGGFLALTLLLAGAGWLMVRR